MRLRRRAFILAAAAAAVSAPGALGDSGGGPAPRPTAAEAPGATSAPPGPGPAVEPPERRTLIHDGQAGRLLLGGTWYFRLDDRREGARRGFAHRRSLRGWQPVRVPHNWNGADTVLNRSSHGWYRREIVLPGGPRRRRALWIARFEGASHHATVYLNGREIGRHSGGYTPFEVDLRGLRRGRNRLVVRLSTLRAPTDLTHWRRALVNGYGTGGWWNFGGLSREVYVRPVRGLDVERVSVLPRLRCTRCRARIEVRSLVRNAGRRARRVRLTMQVGRRVVSIGPVTVRAGGRRELLGGFTIRRPKLWGPRRGLMYGLKVTAAAGPGARAVYRTAFGVRKIHKLADGRVLLNGAPMRLRGASVHEDDPMLGAALGPPRRDADMRRLDELGVDVVRAHYPLHPATLEALDRRGVLVWSQAPVYQVPEASLARRRVRMSARAANRDVVLRDRSHPSIFVWSMANELPELVGPGQAAFIRSTQKAIRRLDPSRLIAIDRSTRVGGPEGHPAVRALDALGVNEYFGWYTSAVPPHPPSTDADIAPRLDGLHGLYRGVALFVTEFGAESNRFGPETEKGTFAFQARWLRDHLAAHDSRPFVNGSIVWALRDFRVHPTWGGGNPLPSPPWNNKGLLEEGGAPKPAFKELERLFHATPPQR